MVTDQFSLVLVSDTTPQLQTDSIWGNNWNLIWASVTVIITYQNLRLQGLRRGKQHQAQ